LTSSRALTARVEAEQLRTEHATGAVAQRMAVSRIPTLRDATTTYLARPKLRSDHNKNQVKAQMENKLLDWLDLRPDYIPAPRRHHESRLRVDARASWCGG